MKVKRYLKRVSIGLYRLVIIRAWPIWGIPFTIYLALLAPYLFKYFNADFWNPDFHLRASGFALQLLFVGVVVKDMYAIIDIFNRPSLSQSIKKWWEDFLNIFSRKTIHATIKLEPASFKMSTSRNVILRQTGIELEKRVKILEVELQDYMKTTNKKIKTIEVNVNKLLKDLNKEKHQREQDLKSVNEIIENISAAGLKWEGAALFWLVVGLFLSTFSSELGFILH